jgi:hypothetical protein
MCDTGGGTSTDFVHTTARQNKSGALPQEKRDYADNPLDKLPKEMRKPLKPADLSEVARVIRDMWIDVNKRA